MVILHKKGSRTDVANYRPITVASAILKTYEKVIYHRIMTHLGKTNDAEPYQGIHEAQGMCKLSQGSLDAVAKLLERLSTMPKWTLVSYDLAKAFDRVVRDSLYVKMRRKGIKGRLLKAVMATYSDSTARIKIGGKTSEAISFAKGIKQGSILSPILFVIFVDDLLEELHDATAHQRDSGLMFMDDLATVNSTGQSLKKTHQIILDWCSKWEATINPTKLELLQKSMNGETIVFATTNSLNQNKSTKTPLV